MKKHSAFSLMELSIVLLVVGIIIAGITQSSRVVRESRIKAASSLTKGTSVNNIKGIVAWFDTVSDYSINSATNGYNPDNNDKVAGWTDINPQEQWKIFTTQATSSLRPTYVTDGINGLPSVSFNNDSYLASLASAGGSVPLDAGSKNYTFVSVWRTSAAVDQVVFEQNQTTVATGKRAGFIVANTGTSYGFNGEGVDAQGATSGFGVGSPLISVITIGQAAGQNDTGLTVNVYTSSNTASYTTVVANGATNQSVSADGFYIGTKGSNLTGERFRGMISEIIIFNRILLAAEIRDVNDYLSKKYHLKIS